MAREYLSDFARGYDYARQRYAELAAGFGARTLLELAATLHKATGSNAELARGIAAGFAELARAEEEGGGR